MRANRVWVIAGLFVVAMAVENDTELRIDILVGGAVVAGLLFLVAWRARSN